MDWGLARRDTASLISLRVGLVATDEIAPVRRLGLGAEGVGPQTI